MGITEVFETDWLASQPVFYNERTGRASHNVNDVIDFANVEFDPEGFNNYLDFGYSVFGQTPVKHVKYLRHSSRLTIHSNGHMEVEHLDDPAVKWIGQTSREDDVWQLLEDSIRRWEKSVEGAIIIPTSGGYDSRLLNSLIEDKSRIRSFTYGVADNQNQSYEVVYARRLSEILGTRWEQIELGDYHRYFDDWDQLYGVSTHAHGMYHIEFYHQLRTRVSGGNPFLSGIIGDAWAGSVDIPALTSGADVNRLGYTHGMHADSAQSMLPVERSLRSGYWESHKHPLQDPRFRVVEAMRFKLILLSYLEVVPRVFGFQWWSPFVDIEVAMAMLNLPPERRRMRAWQKEFFRRHGLDFDSMNLSAAHQNTLNLQALHRIPVRPLDANMLREVVRPDYVEWINHNVLSRPASWQERTLNRLLRVRRVGGALRRVGLTTDAGKQLKAYCAYLVLRPIENLLRKRNET